MCDNQVLIGLGREGKWRLLWIKNCWNHWGRGTCWQTKEARRHCWRFKGRFLLLCWHTCWSCVLRRMMRGIFSVFHPSVPSCCFYRSQFYWIFAATIIYQYGLRWRALSFRLGFPFFCSLRSGKVIRITLAKMAGTSVENSALFSGIAKMPENGQIRIGLLAVADQALYLSKQGGRNRANLTLTIQKTHVIWELAGS